MYGCRDEKINKDKTYQYCLRYNEIKKWEYVIQCLQNSEKNKNFILDLYKKVKKLDKEKEEVKKIKAIVNNIFTYLRKGRV